MHDILLYALPLFAVCIALEWAYGRRVGRDNYRLNDTLSSLSQGLLSQIVALLTPLLQIGLYTLAQPHLNRFGVTALWRHPLGWVMAVVLFDFCDYWLHRVSHESAIFWAAHVVHHQSECFNLSTALRQESLYALLGWAFYLPLAVLGVPPELYATAGLVVLLYQFWIHTEHIGRLGWLDRVFSTPSNHRVHHAVNPVYLDRNYGAILVVWDRLFGSFVEEGEACVYGTVKPLQSWDPLWSVGHFYAELWQRARATRRWPDKLRVFFKAPGWLPPDLRGADLEAVPPARLRQRPYDPPLGRGAAVAAVLLFVAVAVGTGLLLWEDEALSPMRRDLGAAGLIALLWLCGALLSGRMRGRKTSAAAGP